MTKTEEYKKQILKIVQEQRLFFFSDIFAYTTFTRITAYNHKLNEDEEILQLLDRHKIETKHSMRNKWYNSQNPLLQLALYKIIGGQSSSGKWREQFAVCAFLFVSKPVF